LISIAMSGCFDRRAYHICCGAQGSSARPQRWLSQGIFRALPVGGFALPLCQKPLDNIASKQQ
jgi:hypothetical protein